MKTMVLFLLLGSVGMGLLQGQVIVKEKPIAPGVVVSKKLCNSSSVWVPSHWKWDPQKQAYVWIPGKCEPQKRGYIWVQGLWRKEEKGWLYIPGRWRKIKA